MITSPLGTSVFSTVRRGRYPRKGTDSVVGKIRGVHSPFPKLQAFQDILKVLFHLSPIFWDVLNQFTVLL